MHLHILVELLFFACLVIQSQCRDVTFLLPTTPVHSSFMEGNLNCQERELLELYPNMKRPTLYALELSFNISLLYYPESQLSLRGSAGAMLQDGLWPVLLLHSVESSNLDIDPKKWILQYSEARNCQRYGSACSQCIAPITAGDDPAFGSELSLHNVRRSINLYRSDLPLALLLQQVIRQSRDATWIRASVCYSDRFSDDFLFTWPLPKDLDGNYCFQATRVDDNEEVVAAKRDPTSGNHQVYTPHVAGTTDNTTTHGKTKAPTKVDAKWVIAALVIIGFAILLGCIGCCSVGNESTGS